MTADTTVPGARVGIRPPTISGAWGAVVAMETAISGTTVTDIVIMATIIATATDTGSSYRLRASIVRLRPAWIARHLLRRCAWIAPRPRAWTACRLRPRCAWIALRPRAWTVSRLRLAWTVRRLLVWSASLTAGQSGSKAVP